MNYQGILLLVAILLCICSLPCGALPGPIEEGISAAGFELRGESLSPIEVPSGFGDIHEGEPDYYEEQITGEEHRTNVSHALAPGPEGTVPLSRLTAGEINTVQSSRTGLAETGMKTQSGAVVLVPVTPSPEGCGYSYLYPNSDTDYWIYAPGTYTPGSDITAINPAAITITAPTVDLDGNGHTITGNGTGSGTGIMLTNSSITVGNFSRISGFTSGLISTKEVSMIRDSSFTDNYYGVNSSGNSTIITGITANNNTEGILASGSHTTIHDSVTSYNKDVGIVTIDGTNISIRDNAVENNTYGAMLLLGSKSVISNNTVRYNGDGIESIAKGTVITDNTVTSNLYDGIWSFGSNATISGNTMTGNAEYGVYSAGDRTIITKNVIDANVDGIHARGNDTVITGNVFMNNSDDGIYPKQRINDH